MGRFRNPTNHFIREKSLLFFANFIRNHNDSIDNENVFNILEREFPSGKWIQLIKDTVPPLKLQQLQSKSSRRDRLDFDDNIQGTLQKIWNDPSTRKTLRRIILDVISARDKRTPSANELFRLRLSELQETLRLSDFEIDILLVLQFDWNDTLTIARKDSRCKEQDAAIFIAKCLDRSIGEVLNALSPNEKLRRYGCIDEDLDYNVSLECFFNGLEKEPLSQRYFRQAKEEVLPWDFYEGLTQKHGFILKQIISAGQGKNPVNILLYGTPGTGKTSFAQTLAAELKLKCYCITQQSHDKCDERVSSSPALRFAALQICDSQVESDQSLIVVDEADEMLRSSGGGLFTLLRGNGSVGDKGLLNSVMDTLTTPVIWISNTRSDELDESSRRRFDYSIRFDALTAAQRLTIWRNNTAKLKLDGIFDDTMLEYFANRYAVSAGGITLTLQNIAKLNPGKSNVADLVDNLMAPHCELLGIPSRNDKQLAAKDYSLDGLNVKSDTLLPRLVEALRNFQSDNGDAADRPRMNLLLSGPPGTGKTEFVKYLAQKLNTKLIVKMGSDLLSMYVGGSEQNIKQAFAQAEAEKAILFLDEIDGLLQSRERAQRSWEITQVNELLCQMENFNGILIGATNFAANLDVATLRRFTFKVEFDYLTASGKQIFFERMFHRTLTSEEMIRLAEVSNLTPGDFRTVRQSLYYLNGNSDNQDYLSALERESEAKKRNKFATKKVGF